MFISIRGTSGSGKTTVMRAVMSALGSWQSIHAPERRKPLYYSLKDSAVPVLVMGHYESICGGCDNIGSAKACYELARGLLDVDPRRIVLGEGLLLSEDVIWTLKLQPAKCAYLHTNEQECLRRVGQRQQEAGREPIDPERVIRKLTTRVGTIERARVRLEAAGICCRRMSSTQAPQIVLGWIREAMQ